MSGKTVLIADDEERITSLIADFLKAAGINSIIAHDGDEALRLIKSGKKADLAIIDIMMPGLDGWALTKEIRKTETFPIIMLSARSEEFDQLEGFTSGVDEYVTKPFSPAVLVKRVEALIKRSDNKVLEDSGISKGLKVDRNAYTATLDGAELDLTLKEFELLALLFDHPGRVFTRDQLLSDIWGYDYMGDERTVDSHIARLRTKLKDFGVSHLKTVYGMGYKLEM